jgi:DNA (cytosine-5)-methyltransferase 1
MTAYYNEHDPFAAAWLRELIKAGHIAGGEVDERSIEDVLPSDLRQFTQCHFFAGIGVWSYALRQAGWPDDRPVWTGSCPCQPFSAAGKRAGTADERHLWPAFYHLIRECSPRNVFGEQVASKDGLAWFGTVSADLEAAQYAVGGVDLCSAGFGAPHIRQRLYFVGSLDYAHHARERDGGSPLRASRFEQSGVAGGELADSNRPRPGEERKQRGGEFVQSREDEISVGPSTVEHPASEQVGLSGQPRLGRETGVALGDTRGAGLSQRVSDGRVQPGALEPPAREAAERPSLINGFWREAEWIPCRDGKYRPIEPGVAPLATGVANRVGKLRGYGNALTAEVAKGFIESYLEVERGL